MNKFRTAKDIENAQQIWVELENAQISSPRFAGGPGAGLALCAHLRYAYFQNAGL